jgi:hypothetical protein
MKSSCFQNTTCPDLSENTKEIYLYIFLHLVLSISMVAQTNVGGPYFSNQVWNKAGSPYHVTRDVQFDKGYSLTIEPGVVVIFNGDYEILIKDKLIAEGTSTSYIEFHGNNSNKATLSFIDIDLGASSLKYVRLLGPKNWINISGINTNNEFNMAFMEFRNSQLSLTVYNQQWKVKIDSSFFFNSTQHLQHTQISNSYILESMIDLKGENFFSNSYIEKTIFSGHPMDEASDFKNCNLLFIQCWGKVRFNDCYLHHPKIGGFETHAFITMDNCIVNLSGTDPILGREMRINCTEILGNGSDVCIQANRNENRIKNSTIRDCNYGLKSVPFNNVAPIYLDSVNFINNSLYNVYNLSSMDIITNNCWWETQDSASIAAKNYGYYQNINYGKVIVNNPLNSKITKGSCLNPIYYPVTPPVNTYSNSARLKENSLAIVYPNPSKDRLTVKFPERLNGSIIIIWDTQGKTYFQSTVGFEGTYVINLEGFPTGVFLGSLAKEENAEFFKFIKN